MALSESAAGVIAYRAGAGTRQFRWFDRTGRQIGAIGAPDESQPTGPQLSPDGRTVMFRRTIDGNTDLWSIEVNRSVLSRLTSHEGRDYDAVWMPDGNRIVFSSDRSGVLNLYQAALSGGSASAETPLLETSEHKNTNDVSADGRYLLYSVQNQTTGNDVMALPLFGERKPITISNTAARESHGRFSPDGRWVAYASNESGRSEVYLQSYPEPARKVPISTGGGRTPIWRADGRELFFHSLDGQLMAVGIGASGAELELGTPSVLFAMPPGPRDRGNSPPYALSRRTAVSHQHVCRRRLTDYRAAELETQELTLRRPAPFQDRGCRRWSTR